MNPNTSDTGSIDDAIAIARQELQRLRAGREEQCQVRQEELEQAATRYKTVQDAYVHKLNSSPRAHYMGVLKQGGSKLPPLYVLNQQTTLLLALHSHYVLLPHQTRIWTAYQQSITDYLQGEIQQLHKETQESSHQQLSQVSHVAEQNHSSYDQYQTQLDAQQQELRALKSELPKDDYLSSADSDTEHSESSYDGDDSFSKLITDSVVNILHFGKSKMMVRI